MESGEPSPLFEALRTIDAYTLADAARRHGAGGVVHSLKPQTNAIRFVGRALTARIEYDPNREIPLGQYGAAALLDRVSPDDVVVLDGGGRYLSALGDLAAALIERRGGVAAVVNAGVRDAENIDPGFPMFAIGVAISSIARHGFITGVGEPVTIEGVRISTGDILSGCRGGVVVVPWDKRQAVHESALELLESDRRIRKGLEAGVSMSDLWSQHKAPLD